MAKKLFSGVKDYVKNTEYVKEQKPRTVSLGSSLQRTYKSSEPVQRQLSERERAEKERSSKMRSSALVSIAKTMAKNNVTKKTTLPSVAAKMRTQSQTKAQAPKTKVSSSIAHNALAPVSKYASTHRVTGGQGVGNYGFKTNVKQKAIAPAKEIAEYTRKQQNKYVYTPNNDYRFDAKGNMLMKKDPISIEYGNKLRAGMPSTNTAVMSWRGDPTQKEKEYRDRYGYTQRMKEALDRRLNENMLEASYSPTTGEITRAKNGRAMSAGFTDAFARENLEDTLRRQYGIVPDENTQNQIESQRQSLNYGAGMAAGQMAQYALTRGLLGTAGLVGKSADAISDANRVVRVLENRGVKTGTAKAITSFMQEMGIDQAASVPLNLVDAMKADGGANIIKRFGINQGLDVLFSGLFEIPSLRRNMHFLNGNEINEAANAMQEGTEKISTKIGAKRHLDTAVDETGDVARQEAVQISMFNDNGEIAVGRMPKQPRVEQPVVETPRAEVPNDSVMDTATRANADSFFGGNNEVPTMEQISDGTAKYGGLPVKFDPNMSAEASNFTTEIRVSNKFFDLQPDIQRHVLNHEVAHNYADDLMSRSTGRWKEFSNKFIKEKNVPVDSVAYRNGQRTYWEGLYGDIGATSLPETVTRAFTEYLDNPTALRNRSVEAFEEIDNYMRRSIDRNMNAIDVGSRYINEMGTPRAEVPQEPVATPAARATVEEPKVEVPQEKVEVPQEKVETPKVETKAEPKAKPQVEEPKRITNQSELEAETLKPNHKEIERGYDDLIKKVEGDFYDVDYLEKYVKDNNLYVNNNAAIPRKDRLKNSVIANLQREKRDDVLIPLKDRTTESLEREERYLSNDNYAAYSDSDKVRLGKVRDELRKREPKAKTSSTWDEIENEIDNIPTKEPPNKLEGTKSAEKVPKGVERLDSETQEAIEKSKRMTQKEKEASKEAGDYPGGMPKEMEGQPLNKGFDSITRKDADTSDAAVLDIMESVTMGGEGRKVSRGVKETQEEAAARWENDTATSLKKITVATEGLKDGTIPKGYDTFQEYFADVKEGMKYYQKLQKEAGEGSDAYWKAVENEADIARGAAKVTSNMGAGFRQYQEILGASPKARVVIVQKEIKKIEKKFEKLLKGKEIKPLSPEVTKLLEEAKTPVQQAEALEQASIEIWSQIPASLKEKADQWRMTSMLLNPKTHFRNILGNWLFRPAILIKDALSVPGEKLLVKAGKIDPEDATKALVSRLNAKDRTYIDAAKKVWNEYQTLIRRSGGKYFDTVDSKGFLTSRPFEVGRFTAGKEDPNAVQRALDFLAKKNGDALEAEDAYFMRGKFVDSYAKILKARKLDPAKMTEEQLQSAIDDAAQEALRSTYRDASGLANAINKARNYKPDASAGKKLVGWAVDATLPFVKTPVNILRRAKDYSPIGFIEGAANLTKALSKGDSKAAVEALDRVASGLTGGGICALGLFLGQMGLLDSKLEDGSEGFYKQDLGYQNYSLKLGGDDGVSISLSWAAPLSIPLFTGVEYAKMRENGLSPKDWVKFVDVAGRIFDPTMEMSVMQGPMALLEAISDGENGGDKILKGGLSVGLNYVGQYYPTISGQVARTVDPVRRNTSSTAESPTGRALEKWKNKQIAKTPFLSQTLEPYVNVWGEEQKTTDNALLRAAYEFGSPAYVNKIKADEVDKEIIRLNKAAASDDDKIIPSKYFSNAIAFDGGKVSLEAKDLTMYNKIKGKASKEAIRKLIKTDEYKNANNDGKRELINNVMKNASTEAKQKTLISKGKDEWKVYTEGFTGGWEEQADAAKDAGIKAEQYYKFKTDKSVDLDENGGKSQYEVYTYLEGTDLTKSQKSAMWNAYNKGWKNNPYAGGDIPEAPDPDEVELKTAKKEAETLSKAKSRAEGSLAAKAFENSVMKRAAETASLLEDSGKSKSGGKRSRSGRRGGGSSKGSKRKATASEKKFARRSSKLSSVDLEKIYEQTKIKPTKLSSVDLAKIYSQVQKANKAKTPTYKDINVKGLTKSQKNALLKVMMKKIKA